MMTTNELFANELRDLRKRVATLEALEVPTGRPLPYAQRALNPVSTSGIAAGDFAQAQAITILAFRVIVFVSTTNNGLNFWTIELVDSASSVLASVSTASIAASTWARLSDTTITQPSSSNAELAVIVTKTGTPGSLFVIPEVLV